MLPGGVCEDELNEMWGPEWEERVQTLLNFSLLQKKDKEPGQKTRYVLPPFMNNFAEAKICEEDKLLFHNNICHYYADILKKIFDINGKAFKNKGSQSELNH